MLYQITRFIVSIYFTLYHRLSVSGKEKIPQDIPVIVASNHASYLDPPLVGYILPQSSEICGVGKAF